MIGRRISHYRILAEIGGGGMGTVYTARDEKLNVVRALKFIHPHLVSDATFRQRFILEAQAASSLDHPNICSIHEVDETADGRPFICMTYYEGSNLADRVDVAPLPAEEVFGLGVAMAQGLACAHRAGIVHRDIKPANVMLTADGFVKILDFGLAKLTGAQPLTLTGTTLGTAAYMSPEQCTGAEVDHRTDIWSLGVVLYELATGQRPFGGDYDQAVVYAIVHAEPEPVRDRNPAVPAALADLIERCLRKDPEARPADMTALLADLGRVGGELGYSGAPTVLGPAAVGGKPRTRRRWPWVAACGLVAALAAAGTFWRSSRTPEQPTTELRVAVMPLSNRVHPVHDLAADGLYEVVTRGLDDVARRHRSMWVVPNRLVRYAALADDGQAARAFGVNRLVTGSLQRYGQGNVLALQLRDAATQEALVTVTVPFDSTTTTLADSLPAVLAGLVGLAPAAVGSSEELLPRSGPAAYAYLRGLGRWATGEAAGAGDDLAIVVDRVPEFAAGWCDLGTVRWAAAADTAAAARAAALDALARAVALAPDAWRPRFQLGACLRGAGRETEALAALRAADARDPGNPLVCRELSRVHLAGNRPTEAADALRSAVARRPDYFEVQRLLGLLDYRIGEEQAALDQLARTLALAPDDAYTLNTRGAIYYGRGEYARARSDFERAFALAPNCDTCSNIGLMLFMEKRFGESASYYDLSLEYCGRDAPLGWANLATALYWAEGRRSESAEPFRRAIALTQEQWDAAPGDPLVLGNLIEYHAMIGDVGRTRALIAVGDSLAADSGELLYQIGDAYELIGDRSAALAYLAEAMRHGIAEERIRDTPELAELVADPRFRPLAAAGAVTDSLTAR